MIRNVSRLLTAFGLKRHQRRYAMIFIVFLLLGSVYFVFFAPVTETNEKTVVVILGGGVTAEGRVPEHTRLRLEKAYELYNQLGDKALFIPLSGGTPHKPNPLDTRGFPIWESSAAAMKLIDMGVPADQIYEESFSLDTLGNAYFLRTVHIDPGAYTKIIVITNTWHMDRTIALFNHVFSLPPHTTHQSGSLLSFGQQRKRANKLPYNIEYIPVEAGISDTELLRVRKSKEFASIVDFHKTVKNEFHTMSELHDWIFTKHKAYASSRHKNNKNGGSGHNVEKLSDELLKTY